MRRDLLHILLVIFTSSLILLPLLGIAAAMGLPEYILKPIVLVILGVLSISLIAAGILSVPDLFARLRERRFLNAALDGRVATIESLLRKGVSPNASDSGRVTALVKASMRGHVLVVKALLKARANVNIAAKDGGTPLHGAVLGVWTERSSRETACTIVDSLLASGADPNMQMAGSETALGLAAGLGLSEVVASLLRAGANPNSGAPLVGAPLIAALSNNHETVVEMLIQAGADPNAVVRESAPRPGTLSGTYAEQLKGTTGFTLKDFKGFTPLMFASVNGNANVVTRLIQAGADVNRHTADNMTALMAAAQGGYSSCVRLLLAAGADKAIQHSGSGLTAREIALRSGHSECERMLVA